MSKQNWPELSGRELTVLYRAAEGKTDKEIAAELGISEGTLRTYWDRVRNKMEAASRTEAVALRLSKEHQEAIEELRLSELRMSLLIESSDSVAVFFMDPTGTITSWNKGVLNVLGYTEEEFVGQPYSILFREADVLAEVDSAEIMRAIETGRFHEEQWHRKKDDTIIYVKGDLYAPRDENGDVAFLAKVLVDATFEKHLVDEIERMRLKIQELMDKKAIVPDGATVIRTNGASHSLDGNAQRRHESDSSVN